MIRRTILEAICGNDIELVFEGSKPEQTGIEEMRSEVREHARTLKAQFLGPISVRWPLFGSYRRCELLQIDNVAEAYALSILGRYQLPLGDAALNDLIRILSGLGVNVDAILESSSGIHGLTQHPTPQALNRLVFWGTQNRPDGTPNSQFVHDLIDPVVDRHGRDVVATYHGTIFAWEQPGFYEGMTPLLQVLHDPRYENAGGHYAFGALLGALVTLDSTAHATAARVVGHQQIGRAHV